MSTEQEHRYKEFIEVVESVLQPGVQGGLEALARLYREEVQSVLNEIDALKICTDEIHRFLLQRRDVRGLRQDFQSRYRDANNAIQQKATEEQRDVESDEEWLVFAREVYGNQTKILVGAKQFIDDHMPSDVQEELAEQNIALDIDAFNIE